MSRLARVLVVIALVALGMGGGGAVAYWQGAGSGTGQAWVGTPGEPVGVKTIVLVVTTSDLYPGGTADLMVRLQNPNPFPVTLTGVRQDGPITVSGDTRCTADNAGVRVTTLTTLTIVAAASSTSDLHVAAGAAMSIDAADACQSRTFRIPVAVTLRS